MQRSPPTTRKASMDRLEVQLREQMKLYRRGLQKIAKIKTKVLCALRDEGVREAGELLQTPAREVDAVRCDRCVGCTTLRTQGSCQRCPSCVSERECTEHTRLCFQWRQPTTTFVVGSVVTGVSSLCNIVDYDLKKYRELLDQLADASIEVEATLDDFPAGAPQHLNHRYNASRRTRDTANEEEQFLVIEALLTRYQEERVRLHDVDSDDEEPRDDAVDAGRSGAEGFGLTSYTQTHYPFSDMNQPEGIIPPTEGAAPQLDNLGLGLGLPLAEETEEILFGGESFEDVLGPGTRYAVPFVPRPTGVLPVSKPAPTPSTSVIESASGQTMTSGPITAPAKGLAEVAVSPPRKAATRVTTFSTLYDAPRMTPIVSSEEVRTTTTVTTSSTTTTPVSSVADALSLASLLGGRRRRSTSEGEVESTAQRQDKLFRTKQLVATRSRMFSQNLDAVLARAREADGRSLAWVEEELRNCQRDMDRLEELESTTWSAIELLEGREGQKKRIERWRDWQSRQAERMRHVKSLMWDAHPSGTSRPRDSRSEGCQRSSGHVEKVKLPTFNGRQEDFSEFRNQFRELCRGERYTPILELAQLKLKLPREAMAAIAGLQCPEEAWKRLEEVYGNRELSILSALKNLRDFKPAKTAPHEQVIELAMATQKCLTVLKNIGATEEFLGDRESLACVVQALPSSVRDKWYDLDVPEETCAKGKFLITWLEKQRRNAIKVRLDTMASRLRENTAPSSRPAPQSSESTDKGLSSNALHAQGSDRGAAGGSKQSSSPKRQAGDASQGDKPARIEVKTTQEALQVAERRKTNLEAKKLDKCPVCASQHFYERTWGTAQPPVKARLLSTHLTSCAKFLGMSSDEKLATVLSNAGCLTCGSWDHSAHRFQGGKTAREPKCSVLVGGTACGGAHGRWFHEGGGNGSAHSVVAASNRQGPGLYEVYSVPLHAARDSVNKEGTPGMLMVDPGSDTNFIKHECARKLGLVGEPCSFRLKVVDREVRTIDTARYQVFVQDQAGEMHLIDALGLETITVLPPDPDLSPIQPLVRHLPAAVLQRPQGDVDVLLGLRDSALHGTTVQQWGNLRLLKAPIGCGWSLRGTHPDIQHSFPQLGPSLSATAYMLRQASPATGESAHVFHLQGMREFHELEELGTTPPPVCLRCKGCRECTFRRRRLSPAEQEVVARVEREMKVDSISGVITASYPWKNCVNRMVDNRQQAQKVQESMERHMRNAGTHAGYLVEMKKSIQEGKVRRLSEQEMESWHGPLHYITTFAVIKPESVSTKTRVVSNSAMRNARARLSLNECMWPGPNALCDLFNCLLFWRAVEVALMTDLKKAYQSIHTGPMELHLRRFLFREEPSHPWLDYAFTRATFGDIAAGLILEIAKRKVAELGREVDPVAAQQLQDFCYVDDSILGGSQADAERMRGQRVKGEYTGTIPRILSYGAMQVKFMAISGSKDPWEAEQLAGKTLGVSYRLEQDEIVFLIKPGYYSAKARSTDQVRELVVLDEVQVDAIAKGERGFSRRQALSMVMGVYDPLGLVSPALLHGKLLLRRLYGPQCTGGWDADLPAGEKTRWASWFHSLLRPVEAVFPRSTKPRGAVGLPRLAAFGDASASATCVIVYVVWTDKDGVHHPRALTGRCRVAPLLGATIPRGELQALVILHRLIAVIVETFPFQFESINAFSDSLCSIGAMCKPSSALRPYFANRVLEVLRIREQLQQTTCDLAPISHIPGCDNPADIGTRGSVGVDELGPGSRWQVGPDFLALDYKQWPRISSEDAAAADIPQEEARVFFGGEALLSPVNTLLKTVGASSKLGRALSGMVGRALCREKLEMLVRALARALQAVLSGRRDACTRSPSVKMVEIAVRVLLQEASHSAASALKEGKLRGLGAENRGGIVWVSGRIRGAQLAVLLGSSALPVLLPGEPLSRALIHKAHREDH